MNSLKVTALDMFLQKWVWPPFIRIQEAANGIPLSLFYIWKSQVANIFVAIWSAQKLWF